MPIEKFSPQVISTNIHGNDWHTLAAKDVLFELRTLEERGLSSQEVELRLEQFGPNQLAEAPPTTFWQMLWEQFNNFVVMLLIVAAVISALLGDFIEAAAILAPNSPWQRCISLQLPKLTLSATARARQSPPAVWSLATWCFWYLAITSPRMCA